MNFWNSARNILLCAICIMSASATAAFAGTTYYVAPFGDNKNPGTAAEPFRTIQQAANIVEPGDTVIVKDGIYTGGRVLVEIRRGGTPEQWVTFKAEHKWKAVLDGQHNTTAYTWNFGPDASYVRIENFEVRNAVNGFWNNSHQAHHIYIYGNHLHHLGRLCTDTTNGQGLAVFQGTDTSYHTYDGNVIHDNGRYGNGEYGCQNKTHYWQNHDHGLYLCGSHTTITNNIFYNLKHGYSISSGVWSSVRGDKIINNVFAYPNPYRQGFILVHAFAEGNFDTVIANNIFYQPNGYAIGKYGQLLCPVVDMVVQNNLVYRGQLIGSRFEYIDLLLKYFIHGKNPVYKGKLIETQSGYIDLQIHNNIKGQAPLFSDPARYDFHVQEHSPAIDAGLAHHAPTHDIEGNARPQGAGYDIGVYEYIDTRRKK